MDANSWQRWLHMHRLVLILEHDTWVPQAWDGGACWGEGLVGESTSCGHTFSLVSSQDLRV